jgi:hypothetical protein
VQQIIPLHLFVLGEAAVVWGAGIIFSSAGFAGLLDIANLPQRA